MNDTTTDTSTSATPVKLASRLPIAKVGNQGLSAAIVALIIWLLHQFAHVDMPFEVATALIVIISVIVGYITPLNRDELA